MERLTKLLNSTGWLVVTLTFFLLVLGTIVYWEIKSNDYRYRSVEHEITIDLRDDVGGRELEAIRKNLSRQTYQNVYAEAVDPSRNVYKFRVSCPPDQVRGLVAWLRSRIWVEDARQ